MVWKIAFETLKSLTLFFSKRAAAKYIELAKFLLCYIGEGTSLPFLSGNQLNKGLADEQGYPQ